MFFICNPLRARFWFNWREPIALATSAVFFAGIFCGLWFGCDALAAAIVVASLVSYLVKFFWLDKLVLGIRCPNPGCGEFIELDTPWLCGYKQDEIEHENVNTGVYPFVRECEHCHKRPKAYQCHHCEELIYLSVDLDKHNFAKRLGDTKSRIDPRKAKVTEQLEKIEDKTLEFKLTKIEKKIELEKKRGPEEENSMKNGIADIFKKKMDQQFAIEDIQKQLHAAVDEDFPGDDPDDVFERNRRHLAIDAIGKDLRLGRVIRVQ